MSPKIECLTLPSSFHTTYKSICLSFPTYRYTHRAHAVKKKATEKFIEDFNKIL